MDEPTRTASSYALSASLQNNPKVIGTHTVTRHQEEGPSLRTSESKGIIHAKEMDLNQPRHTRLLKTRTIINLLRGLRPR